MNMYHLNKKLHNVTMCHIFHIAYLYKIKDVTACHFIVSYLLSVQDVLSVTLYHLIVIHVYRLTVQKCVSYDHVKFCFISFICASMSMELPCTILLILSFTLKNKNSVFMYHFIV